MLGLLRPRTERDQLLLRPVPVPWDPHDVRDLCGPSLPYFFVPSAVLHYLQTFFVRRDPSVLLLRYLTACIRTILSQLDTKCRVKAAISKSF